MNGSIVENLLALGLTTLVSAFVGSYLASYLKKKGENLATHEDIDKLVDQVRAVTTATKEIEERIESSIWSKQRHWEMKRDALFASVQALDRTKTAFIELWASQVFEASDPEYEQQREYLLRNGWQKSLDMTRREAGRLWYAELRCVKCWVKRVNSFDQVRHWSSNLNSIMTNLRRLALLPEM